jgi:hypothetical protein
VDALGRALFGRSLRLRVLLWVLDQDEAFYQSQAAAGVGYGSSAVAVELDNLERVDMLVKYGRAQLNGRQYYRRQPSVYWAVIKAAQEALVASAASASSEAT